MLLDNFVAETAREREADHAIKIEEMRAKDQMGNILDPFLKVIYVYTYIYIYTCVYMYMYIYIIYIYIYIYVYFICIFVHIDIYIFRYIYVCRHPE